MEVARNPSDKNIERWIYYNQKKNDINQRMQLRMREYLASKGELSVDTETILAANMPKQVQPSFSPDRFRVRMYFDSTCPHCEKMFLTLKELQDRGVYVEALQVDERELNEAKYPIPTRRASREEVKAQKISAIPFTIIADLKRKALFPPISGYKSPNQMITFLNQGETL